MNRLISPIFRSLVFVGLWLFVCACLKADSHEIWILVDTESLVLKVMRGNTPIEVYKNIAIGRSGADYDKRAGDDKSPLGPYRVGWINEESRYHRFFGINYPSLNDAKRAIRFNAIDVETFEKLLRADLFNRTPPQNTVLGGQIGIHGLGGGDPAIHKIINWTHGCIALTNQQIDKLSRWIMKGTKVRIR